jgi:predicted metal-dependent hydrolase
MNQNTKYFDIPDVGKVKITKRQNAVNVRLSIDEGGNVRVSIPHSYSFKAALLFVEEKKAWIIKRLSNKQQQKQQYQIGDQIKTREYIINITTQHKSEIIATKAGNTLNIKIGTPHIAEHDKVQQFIRKVLTEVYRIEAKSYLPLRVQQLASKYGFHFENVFVKNLKSKWGSCSSKKNINLNVHVMTLPDHLIDYIILHELAHTVELNHSERFWNILDKIYGNSKAIDKEMKKYRIEYVK